MTLAVATDAPPLPLASQSKFASQRRSAASGRRCHANAASGTSH
jgi:hypothetical protein